MKRCVTVKLVTYGVRIIEHYTEVSEVLSLDVSFYTSRDQTCCMIFASPLSSNI